jgi:hypothetical protein
MAGTGASAAAAINRLGLRQRIDGSRLVVTRQDRTGPRGSAGRGGEPAFAGAVMSGEVAPQARIRVTKTGAAIGRSTSVGRALGATTSMRNAKTRRDKRRLL